MAVHVFPTRACAPVHTSVSVAACIIPSAARSTVTVWGVATELMAVMAQDVVAVAIAAPPETGLPQTENEGRSRVSFMSSHEHPCGTLCASGWVGEEDGDGVGGIENMESDKCECEGEGGE